MIANTKMMTVKEQNKALSQTSVMTSYYLVRYSGGSYEDDFAVVVFATNKKSNCRKKTVFSQPDVSVLVDASLHAFYFRLVFTNTCYKK